MAFTTLAASTTGAPLAVAGPVAGTSIVNVATGGGINAAGAAMASSVSNPVAAIVQPLETLRLITDRAATVVPGGSAAFTHRLTNLGNVSSDIRLDLLNLPGDGFDLVGTALNHDRNRNGVIDAGDLPIAVGGMVTLAAADSADLIVSAAAPVGAPVPAHAWLRLAATSLGQGAVAENVDTLSTAGTPTPAQTLFVEMRASRAFVELGDDLEYRVEVANRSSTDLTSVVLHDRLPTGFALLPATGFRDTARLADPAVGRGPDLVFSLGALAANAVTAVRYRVRVGPGALDGDGVNRAYAQSGVTVSNLASARVALTGGVFAEEAVVLGTVYMDRDNDGRRSAGDPGIPGVRIYLDDGTFAVTDREGQYSFYGLPPRTIAAKVDPTTLPAQTRLMSLDHRHGDAPGVRFVDLQRGDLQRADFVAARDSALDIQIARRRAEEDLFGDEIRRGATRELSPADDPRSLGDRRSRPASGIAEAGERLPLFDDAERREASAPTPARGADGDRRPSAGEASGTGVDPAATSDARAVTRGISDGRAAGLTVTLEQAIRGLTPGVGFIGLADGDTLAGGQIAVRVQGVAGRALELRVNGGMVPATRIGRKVTMESEGIEVLEYVGVSLAPGVNHLELVQRDLTGSEIARATLDVVAPDRLGRIQVRIPDGVPADGYGLADVRVRALDHEGVPIAGRTFVTLESSLGEWRCDDLDPTTPGMQVVVEGEEGRFALLAPSRPGTATVRAIAGETRGEATLEFLPELRPLLAVGTIEGIVRLDALRLGRALTTRPRTGFEMPISRFSSERVDGRSSAAARAALFVKGRVRDDVLLTVGYDSDRPAGLRRFRDIQPDAFYPVYGDASVRGYDAQSTGGLYARLDRRGASLLYGDFVTSSAGGARSLSAYSRSLTGAQQHYENRRVALDAFTSRERARRRVEELPGRGISGPYMLSAAPIVENSERVEVVVRDRNQTGVVVSATAQSRFTDFEIEPLTGRLMFKSPIPSLDVDLNPVFVRVSYEIEAGGEAAWVSGVESRIKLGSRTELGGSYVDDHDPAEPYGLRAAFAAVQLANRTTLQGEYAHSLTPGLTSGDGGRVEFRHEGAGVQARAYGATTSADFVNPTSGFGAGRTEAGARVSARVAERSRLLLDGLYSADVAGNARRGGLLVGIDQGLTSALRGEFGVRGASWRDSTSTGSPASVALRAKLLAQLPRRPEFSAYGEIEQDVRESSRRLLALGGEYRFTARSRLYARHELISSLSGPYALESAQRRLATVVGVDADLARDAHVFSEYRMADALAGRDAEAAVGLRNAWRVGRGYRVGTSFERVNPISGGVAGPTTAFTGSVENTDDSSVKGSARLELRTARSGDSFLAGLAAACRLDSVWTLLARSLMSVADQRDDGLGLRERLQIGMAYRRPDGEAWDALGRYELRYEDEPLGASRSRRHLAHVVSLHGTGRLFEGLSASLAWAGKHATESADGVRTRSSTHWLHGRWSHDLSHGWDTGLNTSVLFGGGFRSRRDGLGLELGRTISNGVWLSAGWNRFGYQDDDLPEEAYTRSGVYLRLRAKFDESLLTRVPGGGP